MNYYEVLRVSRDADPETIRSAFRALVRRYHPDAGVGSSVQKFREIVEAYETLADPVLRRRYDETLAPARPAWQRPRDPFTSPVDVEPLVPEYPIRRPRSVVRAPRVFVMEDLFEDVFRSFDRLFGRSSRGVFDEDEEPLRLFFFRR